MRLDRTDPGRAVFAGRRRGREAQLPGQFEELGRHLGPELRQTEVGGDRVGPPGPFQVPGLVSKIRETERPFRLVGGKLEPPAHLDRLLERGFRLLPQAASLGDQAPVELDPGGRQLVRDVFEQATGLLVVPFGILDLAEGQEELDAREEGADDPSTIVRSFGREPSLL